MREQVIVSELQQCDAQAWNACVAAHPQGTLFHTLAWRNAVSGAFEHPPCYLAAYRGGRIVGVLPLFKIASRLAGTLLVSVPYAVYGGALADDEQTYETLLDGACALAERCDAQWIDIRSAQARWPQLPILERYVTFRKQLPSRAEDVLSQMPRKARAAARTARDRFGLEVQFDDRQLDEVWGLYSRNMRRLSSLNYPRRFFQLLLEQTPASPADCLAPDGTQAAHLVQTVRLKGRIIAGLVSFIYRGTLMPYFAGCDDRYERCHPNNFLYMSLMERGVDLGCRDFDFGRSRIDNGGAYNFKRFQGFEPTPLQYQYVVPKGGRAPDLHPGNPRLELARRVWPRLPLAVTRPLGAWLAKSIPG